MTAEELHKTIKSLDATREKLVMMLEEIDREGIYASHGGRKKKRFLSMQEARKLLADDGIETWHQFQIRKRDGFYDLVPSNPRTVWLDFTNWGDFFAMKVV